MISQDSVVLRSGQNGNVEFDSIGSVIHAFIAGDNVKLYNEYNNLFQRIVSVKTKPVESDCGYYALKFAMNDDSGHKEFDIIVSDETNIGIMRGEYVIRWMSVNEFTDDIRVSDNIKLVSRTKQGYNGTVCSVITDCGYFIVNGIAVQCC